jgi:V8-like Glu-specific endopeptidase
METTSNRNENANLEAELSTPDVPGTGEMPAALRDPANYLVFDRLRTRGDQAIELHRQDGRAVVTDDQVVLGIVAEPATAVTTEELAREQRATGAAEEGEGYAPDWITRSVTPRLAPERPARKLSRRNGRPVHPEVVIHPDGRNPYYPNTYPMSCVGRLFVWENAATVGWSWRATASLVSPNAILTASHCVPWGSSNWKALFIPAFYGTGSIFGTSAASWVTNAQGYRSHVQGDDMAVMRLAVRLGDSLGYFGYTTYNSDWEDLNLWSLPGYAKDRYEGNYPVVHAGFPIIDDDNDGAGVELEYRADTEEGQSGAPVHGIRHGSQRVVGTHSGGEDNTGEPRQNVAAGGPALSNLLAWARQNWP